MAVWLIGTALCLLMAGAAHAGTFIKEFTYEASPLDDEGSAKALALEGAKGLLLEEISTQIKDRIMCGYPITGELTAALVGGVVSPGVIEGKWDGKTYHIGLRASLDIKETAEAVERLCKDSGRSNDLLKAKLKAESALKEARRGAPQGSKEAYAGLIRELSASGWFQKGHALAYSGDLYEAVNAFSMAVELSPSYAEAYLGRGVAYFDSGRVKEALKDCNKAIALNPDYAEAYFHRGNCYYREGKFKRAIKDYDRAVGLNPRHVWAHSNRADAYGELGKTDRAVEDYNRAIAIDPEFSRAYHHRGNVFYNLGFIEQAAQDYDITIELDPENVSAYYHRGLANGNLGRIRQALNDFTVAIKLRPAFAEAYLNRGLTYDELGAFQSAMQDYQKAAELGLKDAVKLIEQRMMGGSEPLEEPYR